ncbi:alpha/beta hydrolase [Leptolyngbya sp. PCC 6406]|uniref:alpha/beta hydrolase n=1 Tax=Leptolyngbya sp. PCC 6406 TaxID=1173264 RepID=UPI0002ACCC03|nr:dienelactone hydrolase family protein [Leptolyngbya sp. PCC 6406]
MTLRAITQPATTGIVDYLFIGLHGWGANGADLAALGTYLNLPHYTKIFPDAPLPLPQVPGGCMWYDFPAGYDFRSSPQVEHQADLQATRQQLRDWIEATAAAMAVPLERTVVAGFSQGGAMAMDVALQLPLAAVLVLSGYLHSDPQPHQPSSPVFMVHGRLDPVVPIAAAHQARDRLQSLQVSVAYQEWDMGHEITLPVLQAIQEFCQGL